jgi:hypothetical protein
MGRGELAGEIAEKITGGEPLPLDSSHRYKAMGKVRKCSKV